jgi:hypothetical protein
MERQLWREVATLIWWRSTRRRILPGGDLGE